MSKRILAAIAAMGFVATASAAVIFDPATGMGSVGKGDVQLPFSWNDAALQQKAGSVFFTYAESETQTQDCYSHLRGTFTLVGSRTKTKGVNATVASSTRNNRNSNSNFGVVSHFNLVGWGSETLTDTKWVSSDGGEAGPTGCPLDSQPHGQPIKVITGEGLYVSSSDGGPHLIYTPPN